MATHAWLSQIESGWTRDWYRRVRRRERDRLKAARKVSARSERARRRAYATEQRKQHRGGVAAVKIMAFAEDEVMPFGKHQGKTLREIVTEDPAYIDWLAGQEIKKPSLRTAIRTVRDVYASEIDRFVNDD